MNTKHYLVFFVLLALLGVHTAPAAEPTAFSLIKKGDEYLGVQSKDKVVQIRSEKSIASLTPDIWYVVYYDPDATLKAVQVEFGGGEKLDVSHPFRLLEMASDAHEILDNSQLKVDSDKAIRIATTQPLLKNLSLKSTQLWLEHGDLGPQWRVQIWAAKLADPTEEADIGVVTLSATDGTIIKDDLHPNSVE